MDANKDFENLTNSSLSIDNSHEKNMPTATQKVLSHYVKFQNSSYNPGTISNKGSSDDGTLQSGSALVVELMGKEMGFNGKTQEQPVIVTPHPTEPQMLTPLVTQAIQDLVGTPSEIAKTKPFFTRIVNKVSKPFNSKV